MSSDNPKPLRIDGDELPAPVERVEQALEHDVHDYTGVEVRSPHG